MISYSIIKTPVDDLTLAANESALIGIYFKNDDSPSPSKCGWKLDPKNPILQQAAKQILEYFDGKRTEFTVPLQFSGTEFQERVWREIAKIPFGKTISYGELARKAGKPQAIRAAGSNTGRNPLPVIVPCHRVLAKGGIGGFGGGLKRKRYLLELEGCPAMDK